MEVNQSCFSCGSYTRKVDSEPVSKEKGKASCLKKLRGSVNNTFLRIKTKYSAESLVNKEKKHLADFNCGYHINKLSIESMCKGNVKTSSLERCLKNVKNSTSKVNSADCADSLECIRKILHTRGSKVLDKKLAILDKIASSSVSDRFDNIQAPGIKMHEREKIVWDRFLGCYTGFRPKSIK